VIGVVDRQLDDVSKQMARLKALQRDLTRLRTRLTHAVESGSAGPDRACPCFAEDEPVNGSVGS
jgi:hypothetical protein